MTRLKELFSVLTVSSDSNILSRLRPLLDSSVYETPNQVKSKEEARRTLLQKSYDLVIIDFPDMELAFDLSEKSGSAVIVLCDGSRYEEMRYALEPDGVAVVERSFTDPIFSTALNLSMAAHNRILAMEEENKKLRFKNEELRLVNRAKWALHENLGMDEPAAHRYIEKTAMNNRITRYTVAKNILKEYE